MSCIQLDSLSCSRLGGLRARENFGILQMTIKHELSHIISHHISSPIIIIIITKVMYSCVNMPRNIRRRFYLSLSVGKSKFARNQKTW
ncbi:hypothetical protein K440DRAFT_2601 [Wilcoxina mikolae CBS 423.85]|nr:hypothetical protein K440DRAFT_2601 [Wilcoxina mikolae CBS 423.85]